MMSGGYYPDEIYCGQEQLIREVGYLGMDYDSALKAQKSLYYPGLMRKKYRPGYVIIDETDYARNSSEALLDDLHRASVGEDSDFARWLRLEWIPQARERI